MRSQAELGNERWRIRFLNLRFPARFVFPLPQVHRLIVAEDVAVGGVAGERRAGAVGDVAEVAEERASVSDFDFGVEVQVFPFADRSHQVVDVRFVVVGTFSFVDQLVVLVEELVVAVGVDFA